MNERKAEDQLESFSKFRWFFKRYFVNPMLNRVIPGFIMKCVLKHCKSTLIKESFREPGSWRVMQLCYENASGQGWFHWMATKGSPLAIGVRNRKRLVVRNLIRFFKEHHKVCLFGVGTGPGLSIMEAMSAVPEADVRSYCVDTDDSAFAYGEELKKKFNINGKLTYIHSSASDAIQKIPEQPNIIKMVGLLEHLENNEIKKLCQFAFDHLVEKGILLVNTLQSNDGTQPFMEKYFGLRLINRSETELIELLSQCGFRTFKVDREPLRVYSLITATKE